VTVYESDLPGVGKKHEVELGDGSRLVIVTHNTGKREVFRRPTPEADSEKLFDMTDQLARQVGTLLEGAYFQPVRSREIETVLDGETVLEWVTLAPESEYVGRTLGEADIRGRTGVSIIAIQRETETIANPGADERLAAGDTLIALGPREDCRSFRRAVGAGTDAD
jgi:TrkA domain protein